MKFIKTDLTGEISELRSKLYQKLTAPIDAMWEQLYIASSQHYFIKSEDVTLGYCCINSDACLLQIFLEEQYSSKMKALITKLIDSKLITSASLSSKEPLAFNACLSLSKSVKKNTICYEHTNIHRDIEPGINLEVLTKEAIPSMKVFLKEQVGMDDTFGYTENLVSRKEIFVYKDSKGIIASSECRMSDSQPEIADLGIIVNRNFQDKGLATQIMQMQVNRVLKAGRKPICSTTAENIASQKAIERSGFYCSNIIFDLNF